MAEREPALRSFGFFNCRFEQKLWPALLESLKLARVKDTSNACNVLLVEHFELVSRSRRSNFEGIEVYNTVPHEPSPSLV